jgi:hypothetical protein
MENDLPGYSAFTERAPWALVTGWGPLKWDPFNLDFSPTRRFSIRLAQVCVGFNRFGGAKSNMWNSKIGVPTTYPESESR